MSKPELFYTIDKDQTEVELFARSYLDCSASLLAKLDVSSIVEFTKTLLSVRNRGARIFFIGNGGSAATASHFANDFAIGSKSWHKPIRALSLVDNIPIITAIANDDGYDEIFVQQLKVHMAPGDMVVAISASGNSVNVVRAIEYANANGGITAALTGFDGGKLKCITQIVIHVTTAKGDYGHVEDIHMLLDHLIGGYLLMLGRRELEGGG